MGLGQSGTAHRTTAQLIGGSVACSVVNTAVLFCFVMLAKSLYLLGHTGQHCPGGVMGLGQSGAAHRTTAQLIGGLNFRSIAASLAVGEHNIAMQLHDSGCHRTIALELVHLLLHSFRGTHISAFMSRTVPWGHSQPETHCLLQKG